MGFGVLWCVVESLVGWGFLYLLVDSFVVGLFLCEGEDVGLERVAVTAVQLIGEEG